MKLRLTSFPLQLIAVLVLPLLLLLVVVALGSVALHQSAMRDMLANHNIQLVRGAAASLSEQIELREAFLRQLATTPTQNTPEWTAIYFDGGTALYTPDGRVLSVSSEATDWDSLWETIRHAEPDTGIVPLLMESQGDTRLVIWASGSTGNTAVGIVSSSAIGIPDLLMNLHTEGENAAYLVGDNRQILYHSDPTRIGSIISEMPASNQSEYRQNNKGSEVITTSAPVSLTDWTLVQEEQWEQTISPLLRYTQTAPLVLVPGLLLTFIAVWFGIRQIVYPLQRLENQATSLDWGDLLAIDQPVGGIEEIQRLQATLRHMVQRIQKAQAGMHNYIGAITRAQEDERLRLARELHDQTAQSLVALNHRIQMIAPHLKDDSEAADLVAETRLMIMQTLDELRRVVRALRPVYLEELGLVPALQMLARDLDQQITVTFEKTGSPHRLAAEKEIAIYRIAQEALNNARRHSEASQIWLTVQFDDHQITVSVRDNGQGFAAPRHAIELTEGGQGHFGIIGMYERASLIGAHLHIQAEPGKGTTVMVRSPIR